MGVLYKLNVSLMHKSSLFQENKMTQKSKLYNFNMLFECVISLTMLWEKKQDFFRHWNNRWSLMFDPLFAHASIFLQYKEFDFVLSCLADYVSKFGKHSMHKAFDQTG